MITIPFKFHSSQSKRTIKTRLVCIIIASLHCSNYFCAVSAEEDGESTTETPTERVHEVHSRQKRFVYINTMSPVDIGFLIVIPFSFALPTFNLQTSRRYKKSVTLEQESLANLTDDEVFPKNSYDDPAYGIETRKIVNYFTALKVDEDICQQKVICEIFSNPDEYSPLSKMLAKNLMTDHGPIVETNSSRYYRYIRAMQEGVSGGENKCKSEYERCPYSTQDRVNIKALLFWNWLVNLLSMDFKD